MKEQIKTLLQENFFISEPIKVQVLEKLDSLNDSQLSKIFEMLTMAQAKQANILKNALTENPNLLAELKHMTQEDFLDQKHKEEAKDRSYEEDLLKNLDDELLIV